MDERRAWRIGEVARRTGMTVSALRAWERRYGIPDPDRTDGGHRLYGPDDVDAVRTVQDLVDQGWAVASAAEEARRRIREGDHRVTVSAAESPAAALRDGLRTAVDEFDDRRLNALLDDTFARFDLAAALDEVVLPVLRTVGEGWEQDPAVVAREHFASHALRPRLLRVVQTSPTTRVRRLVAASPESEEHDLGLLAAAAVAAADGWDVSFLGARTPAPAMEGALRLTGARILLVGGQQQDRSAPFLDAADRFEHTAVVLGGTAFTLEDAARFVRGRLHDGSMREVPDTLAAAQAAVSGLS